MVWLRIVAVSLILSGCYATNADVQRASHNYIKCRLNSVERLAAQTDDGDEILWLTGSRCRELRNKLIDTVASNRHRISLPDDRYAIAIANADAVEASIAENELDLIEHVWFGSDNRTVSTVPTPMSIYKDNSTR